MRLDMPVKGTRLKVQLRYNQQSRQRWGWYEYPILMVTLQCRSRTRMWKARITRVKKKTLGGRLCRIFSFLEWWEGSRYLKMIQQISNPPNGKSTNHRLHLVFREATATAQRALWINKCIWGWNGWKMVVKKTCEHVKKTIQICHCWGEGTLREGGVVGGRLWFGSPPFSEWSQVSKSRSKGI